VRETKEIRSTDPEGRKEGIYPHYASPGPKAEPDCPTVRPAVSFMMED